MGIPFSTEASINLADDEELMQMMVEAGFSTVFIGIETPDEDSLAECSKKQNMNRDLVQDVKRIQRAGLQVQGGFIVGFDNDTPSIFQRQIDFIQKSGIVTAMVGLLQAPPGTRLYERLKQEGRLLDRLSGDNVDGTTNIIPKMDLETLRQGYTRVMRHIYSPKHYYQRVKTFLREYRPPKIKAPLDLQYVLAFFRSIYHLGIVDQARGHYWKLFSWTLFHRPGCSPWRLRWRFTAFISARSANCMPFDHLRRLESRDCQSWDRQGAPRSEQMNPISSAYLGKIKPAMPATSPAPTGRSAARRWTATIPSMTQWREYLGPLGAKQVRLQGGWAKCEREPGVYEFAWLDAIVDDVLASGRRSLAAGLVRQPDLSRRRRLFPGRRAAHLRDRAGGLGPLGARHSRALP